MNHYLRSIGLLITSCVVGLATAVEAAEIKHLSLDDGIELITIEGEITEGDEETFRKLSVQYDSAVVALASDGGALGTAIEIGKMIRIKEFPTLVLNDFECTSACALIWVAGSTRFLSPGGRVGFHASYRDVGGKKVETGVGNALVGRYLTLLNFPEKAILFATAAPPDRVLWLTPENMRDAGIEFDVFQEATEPPPIVRTHVSTSKKPSPQIKQGLELVAEGDTTKHYLNWDSVHIVGKYRAVWTHVDHSKDPEVDYFGAKDLWYYDCAGRRRALKAWVNLDANGRVMRSKEVVERDLEWNTVVPDSIGEAQHEAVCK